MLPQQLCGEIYIPCFFSALRYRFTRGFGFYPFFYPQTPSEEKSDMSRGVEKIENALVSGVLEP